MKIENLNTETYMRIVEINKRDDLNESEKTKEIISVFHNKKVSKKEADETMNSLAQILSQDFTEIVHRFTFNGVEYGMIPNFEKMSAIEFIDLDDYLRDGTELDRILAILYRPVTERKGDLYRIEEYEGTDKYVDIMRKVDFSIAQKGIVFFSILGNELLKYSQLYIQRQKEIMKRKNSTSVKKRNFLKSMAGTISCIWRRKGTTSKSKRSENPM